MGRRTMTTAEALRARAGRAHEDPVAMTQAANDTKIARAVAEVLKLNPELTPLQAARGARLKIKAEMAALAARSATARRGDVA
jgi:hypothetical protein